MTTQATAKKEKTRGQRLAEYREGGEGFAAWAEDHVYLPIYPEGSTIEQWVPLVELPRKKLAKTGKSYYDMWEYQKEILYNALAMENGEFLYTLLVFCWQRGEGKSLLACLIQLWKFFCWIRQKIMLGANSKEQTKFVHYDIMRDIIRNSPPLLRIVGEKNIQEKEIRLTNKRKETVSMIRSISTASGIVSNITGYTFSEIFDMKNPKFFVQLDGSIRNIPNALGVIDSTVSEKSHVLYQIFEGWKKGEMENVFFSYRSAPEPKPQHYWNPHMDQKQLNSYKYKFPFGEFERYFLNLWSAGVIRVFPDELVEETNVLGAEGQKLNHDVVNELLTKKHQINTRMVDSQGRGFTDSVERDSVRLVNIEEKLTRVDELYQLSSPFGPINCITGQDLVKLSDYFDTDWAILAGLDMADPTAIMKKARTILTVWAKGLYGSRRDMSWIGINVTQLKFIYLLIGFVHVEDSSMDTVKDVLTEVHVDMQGLDSFCSETYGAWDMKKWCEDRSIRVELVSASYNRQRDAYKEYYLAVKEGRLKRPRINIPGSKKEDIFVEEMEIFNHDTDKKWFGSPEKDEKHGIQDDTQFSSAWGLYGGRNIGPELFRPRTASLDMFGSFFSAPRR